MEGMNRQLSQKKRSWVIPRHVRIVQLGKPEGRLTQLAVLFLGVGQPFYQARLVDELDAPTAFARIKQLVLIRAFTTANPTRIWFFKPPLPSISIDIRSVGRVIHHVRESPRARIVAGLREREIHFRADIVVDLPTFLA